MLNCNNKLEFLGLFQPTLATSVTFQCGVLWGSTGSSISGSWLRKYPHANSLPNLIIPCST